MKSKNELLLENHKQKNEQIKKGRDILIKNINNINDKIETKILNSMNRNYSNCKVSISDIAFDVDLNNINLIYKDKEKLIKNFLLEFIKEDLIKNGFFVSVEQNYIKIFWNKKSYLFYRVFNFIFFSIIFIIVVLILLITILNIINNCFALY